MRLEDFIMGNGETAMAPDEFMESFQIEDPWPHSANRYGCLGLREAMEVDMVNVAVNLACDPSDGTLNNIRIVLGAVAPKPLRARDAEALLLGKDLDEALISKAGEACAAAAQPIDDIRASADYRREMVKVLVGRVLKEAYQAIAPV